MSSYVIERAVEVIECMMRRVSLGHNQVLVVGPGPGWMETKFPANQFVTVDISSRMAKISRSRNRNAETMVSSGEFLPFSSSGFPIVISSRAIKFMKMESFLSESARVLSKNGKILIIYDSGDALWFRALEWLGWRGDKIIRDRTTRHSDLEQEVAKRGLIIEDEGVLTMLPLTLIS